MHLWGVNQDTTNSEGLPLYAPDTQDMERWVLRAQFQPKQTGPYPVILSTPTAVKVQLSSGQFSRSVMSDSLRPHESQYVRPPCLLPTPGVHPNYVHQVSDAIQPSHPLSSPSPPAPNPPQHQGLFPMSQLCVRWPKYWSLSLSISPSNEHPGLISFRMDWLDLLAVQGTLKSLLQHHSSKASFLWRSAFFTVQLSHPYMTTGRTIALTRRTFVGKVISLLFNMLSRLVITFLDSSQGTRTQLWDTLVSSQAVEGDRRGCPAYL